MAIVTLIGGLLLMFGLFALAAWLWFTDPQLGAAKLDPSRPVQAASMPAAAPAAGAPASPVAPAAPAPVEGSTEIFDPSVFTMPAAPEGGGDKTQILSDLMPGFPPDE